MQYVRCESCGAKAILAASRCPKCTHPLELRDHHGEFVPLAQCRKCDTWYPRTRGGCKWCGTKASEPRSASLLVGGLAVILALGVGALVWRGRQTPDPAPAVPAPVATSPAPTSLPEPTSLTPADTTTRIDSLAAPVSDPGTTALPTPAPVAPLPPTAAVAAAGGRTDTVTFVRFARARVVEYVNVRSEPSPNGKVLAVLTPGVRVEFGGRQGGWRLVRAEGVTGWADPRNFRVDSAPPR